MFFYRVYIKNEPFKNLNDLQAVVAISLTALNASNCWSAKTQGLVHVGNS